VWHYFAHHFSWKCRMSACQPNPPEDRHLLSAPTCCRLPTCQSTCRRHRVKTCRLVCRHGTTSMSAADMSALCRQMLAKNFGWWLYEANYWLGNASRPRTDVTNIPHPCVLGKEQENQPRWIQYTQETKSKLQTGKVKRNAITDLREQLNGNCI